MIYNVYYLSIKQTRIAIMKMLELNLETCLMDLEEFGEELEEL